MTDRPIIYVAGPRLELVARFSDPARDCPHCGRPLGDLDASGTTGRRHPESA